MYGYSYEKEKNDFLITVSTDFDEISLTPKIRTLVLVAVHLKITVYTVRDVKVKKLTKFTPAPREMEYFKIGAIDFDQIV